MFRSLIYCCKVATAFSLFSFMLVGSQAHSASLRAYIDQREGLPSFSIGGLNVLNATFVFWQKNWGWAGLTTNVKIESPFNYTITGKNKELNFDLSARVDKPTDRQFTWDIELNAHSTTPDAIGGGISFRFDLVNFTALGAPELLPDNRGWFWGRADGPHLEMRFDPPLPSVYFERGQKSEIRAIFYKGEVPEGRRRYIATLSVSDDVTLAPTVAERFGLEDQASWTTSILNWPIAPWNVSPVDLSFLNAAEKPAGKRGFVKRGDDGRMVFEDGTPARFWGTNLTAAALFDTDRENTRQQARRLSQLGFNLVRFHHHDSTWVSPNIFGDNKLPNTLTLNSSALEKLDWWIKCLKDEGIYVWLDLHVGREFKAADGIENFDEISKGKPTANPKGFNYINASIQEAMRRFNESYISHLNPFTGLQYKDDPTIIALLLTNENDVTNHFGNALLPDKKVPAHNALYMAQANEFAAAHGLSKDKTWRSWEHGPSKLFLNDLEQRFDRDQIGSLRKLGARTAIVTTSTWGANPVSSLPALTLGDFIAVHSYGGVGTLERNPFFGPNLMHWIAAAHVVGWPVAVPEWNVSNFPVPDRHSVPLYLASAANFQGWDAMMEYAYSQQGLNVRGVPSNWHAFNDPALIATLPAAALLYRRHDVQESRTTYVYAPDSKRFFDESVSPVNSPALRTAAEKGKLMIALPKTPELPWLEPSRIPQGATIITDPKTPLLPVEANGATSDTGELRRDWEAGTYTIDTPRTQAAMGWIGGKTVSLADIEVAATTRNATVAVQSLEDAPINQARKILISLGARSNPQGNNQPFRSEPVVGRLAIRAKAGLKLYRQHGIAADEREIPASYENGRYVIELTPNIASYWMVLKEAR